MKKLIAYILVFIMLFSNVSLNTGVVTAETKDAISNPITSSVGGAVWDCIYFGEYPQSKNEDGTYSSEPIKWRVLNTADNKALLISDKILDGKAYCDSDTEIDYEQSMWANSSLRKWLNGYSGDEDSFISKAFSEKEKDALITQEYPCDYLFEEQGDEQIGIGSFVNDKVTCLSYETLTDRDNDFFDYEKNIEITDFAKNNGVSNESWYLRTTGVEDTFGMYVLYYEESEPVYEKYETVRDINYADSNVDIKGVRPVIYIDLTKADWIYAGTTVCGSDGIVQNRELHDPVIDENGVVAWDCIRFGKDTMTHSEPVGCEDMLWRVLSVNGDEALLISDTTISINSYNLTVKDKNLPAVWETSDLRSYLNGNFMETRFTETEKNAIIAKKITNPDNPEFETDSGKSTKDKVYVLSVNEARNDNYGFRNTTKKTDTRSAESVAAAFWESDWDEHETNYECRWWLRTAGKDKSSVAYVETNGKIRLEGAGASNYIGVRPVINLDLTAPVWRYAGVETAGKVDKVIKLEFAGATSKSVTLNWLEEINADGYKVYKYNSKTGKYVLVKTIKNGSAESCVINNLTPGSGYKFKVRAYMGNKPVYGKYSDVVTAMTKPLKVTINKPTTGKAHYVKVTWKKRNCSGYEVKLATNSKFTKGVKTYQAKSNKTLSKKFTGLKKGKRYYVKVRAYKEYNGARQYGSWSSIKSVYCK